MNVSESTAVEPGDCALAGLLLTLPGQQPSVRTRVWRALRALGAALLRDGLYVLPAGAVHEARLDGLASEIAAAGGSAERVQLLACDAQQADRFRRLFARDAEFGELLGAVSALRAEAPGLAAPLRERRLRMLQRQCAQLAAIDFFPGEARAQVQRALADCARRLAGDEPQAVEGACVRRLERAAYQQRCWATRCRPWVDRLASAWLIARHIDAAPRFLWLADPAACPADALGYDFDGAQFTHVGGGVSYETLLASFGLDADVALLRLGTLVHALDTGGVPVAEAAGLAALLAGACAAIADDDALLAATLPVFDWLYRHFQESEER
ncbi:MAG: chromate resistance protein [Proteobacteria bacterium]|nr:chromate resistance protein [Pseudomonadota bacterium]